MAAQESNVTGAYARMPRLRYGMSRYYSYDMLMAGLCALDDYCARLI